MKDKSNTILQQVPGTYLTFVEKSFSQRPMLSKRVNKCLGRSQKLILYTNRVQVIRPEIMNVERIDNIGPISGENALTTPLMEED